MLLEPLRSGAAGWHRAIALRNLFEIALVAFQSTRLLGLELGWETLKSAQALDFPNTRLLWTGYRIEIGRRDESGTSRFFGVAIKSSVFVLRPQRNPTGSPMRPENIIQLASL